jgi:hypothetical protein
MESAAAILLCRERFETVPYDVLISPQRPADYEKNLFTTSSGSFCPVIFAFWTSSQK